MGGSECQRTLPRSEPSGIIRRNPMAAAEDRIGSGCRISVCEMARRFGLSSGKADLLFTVAVVAAAARSFRGPDLLVQRMTTSLPGHLGPVQKEAGSRTA